MIDPLERSVNRLSFLRRSQMKCPECGAAQVQLVNFMRFPAEWKCRECKHRWCGEPTEGLATQPLKK